MQLQKILVGCYSHRLDHDEAMNTSLGAALKKIASSSMVKCKDIISQ